jgi:hypothetical protein
MFKQYLPDGFVPIVYQTFMHWRLVLQWFQTPINTNPTRRNEVTLRISIKRFDEGLKGIWQPNVIRV